MKNALIIIGLLFSMQFIVAQSLIVTGDSYFTGGPLDEITHHLDVKNIANKGITVVCQKTIISSPATLPIWAGASYCFAGNCYSSSSTSPSSTAVLGSGLTFSFSNNDMDAFSGYYNPAETTGITVVEYCFYDEVDPSDNTCVTISYDISSNTGISEVYKMSEFYPNPANRVVQFEYYLNEPSVLILMDVLGNHVKTINLTRKGLHKINVSDFSEGIYFCSILVNNKSVATKKLIIN